MCTCVSCLLPSLWHGLFNDEEAGCFHDPDKLAGSVGIYNGPVKDVVPHATSRNVLLDKGLAKGLGVDFSKRDAVGVVVHDLSLGSQGKLERSDFDRIDKGFVVVQKGLGDVTMEWTKQFPRRPPGRIAIDQVVDPAVGGTRWWVGIRIGR